MKLAPPPYTVDVRPPTTHIPAGVYFSLETPLPGAQADSLVIEVAGWVAHTDRCEIAAPAEVAILVNGDEWLASRVELARGDVGPSIQENFGETISSNLNGFSFTLPVHLSVKPETVYTLVALLGPERHPGYVIATISFSSRTDRLDHGSPAKTLAPVLINSLGRSGSSVLCRILAAHPAIYCARGANQFGELRVLEFISRLVSVASSEGSSRDLNKLETRLDFHSLDAPAFASRILSGADQQNCGERNLLVYMSANVVKFAQGYLAEYFAQIEKSKPDAEYLVEKSWNMLSTNNLRIVSENVKEIFLVRHPRDLWNSQIAFLRKEHISDEDLGLRKRALAQQFRAIGRAWRDRRGYAILVHYEDLLTNPDQTLAQIFKYLGRDLDPVFAEKAAGMLGDSSDHAQMLRTHADGQFDAEFDAYLRDLESSTREDFLRSAQDLGYEL